MVFELLAWEYYFETISAGPLFQVLASLSVRGLETQYLVALRSMSTLQCFLGWNSQVMTRPLPLHCDVFVYVWTFSANALS